MKNIAIIPALALLLQGCIPTTPPTTEWLEGSWVPEGTECASDGGIVFLDGKFESFNSDGTWQLNGNALNLTVVTEYDENQNPITPKEDKVTWTIESFDQNTYTATIKDLEVKWNRCQKGDELVKPTQQKIVWEWTQGYSMQQGAFVMTDKCKAMSQNIQQYLDDGWKIISTVPFERYVTGGTCQGRDVVLEKSS